MFTGLVLLVLRPGLVIAIMYLVWVFPARGFRFTLRTLLLAITLAAIVLGFACYAARKFRKLRIAWSVGCLFARGAVRVAGAEFLADLVDPPALIRQRKDRTSRAVSKSSDFDV